MKKINFYIKSLRERIDKITSESKRQLTAFGFIFFINYPLYYLIWIYASPQGYENLFLRLSASFFCLLLIFRNYWPSFFKAYLSFYWYFTVTYCVPFFFFFMTLKNNFSVAWLMNSMLAIFLTFLLFDLVGMFFVNLLGLLMAFALYFLTGSTKLYFEPGSIDLQGALMTFLAGFVVVAVFNRNREKIEKEKIQILQLVGSGIAHELRTPLASIKFGLENVRFLVLDIFNLATSRNAEEVRNLKRVEKNLNVMDREVNLANTMIDIFLENAKVGSLLFEKSDQAEFPIKECVKEALERYPFKGDQMNLVDFSGDDFLVNGRQILLEHILFNLIKNSLHYISGKQNGKIILKLERGKSYNVLYFKDNGMGINKKDLPHVFDRFFSKTRHGAGIGLHWVKMAVESMRGKISCESAEGQYTLFKISLPLVK